LVYNPMGCIHRFQMRTESDVVTFLTPPERPDRGGTILVVEEYGPPVPTVPGFVVPGDENTGPVSQRGPRCPLSQLRTVTFSAGEGIDESPIPTNEHWVVLSGELRLTVGQREITLSQADVALLRAGVVRSIQAEAPVVAALARE
jgi:quercetin dioxygenase-like cupin family protein